MNGTSRSPTLNIFCEFQQKPQSIKIILKRIISHFFSNEFFIRHKRVIIFNFYTCFFYAKIKKHRRNKRTGKYAVNFSFLFYSNSLQIISRNMWSFMHKSALFCNKCFKKFLWKIQKKITICWLIFLWVIKLEKYWRKIASLQQCCNISGWELKYWNEVAWAGQKKISFFCIGKF